MAFDRHGLHLLSLIVPDRIPQVTANAQSP